MVFSFDLGTPFVILLYFVRFDRPRQSSNLGNELVVVALLAPFLDSVFVRRTVAHERVERPRCLSLLVRLGESIVVVTGHVRHHVGHRYVVVLGHDGERVCNERIHPRTQVYQRPVLIWFGSRTEMQRSGSEVFEIS